MNKEVEDHGLLLRLVEHLPEASPWKKKLTKIVTVLLALFLLFLVLIYLVPGYDLLSILEGRVVSKQITDLAISLPDGKRIVFQKDAYDALQQIYLQNQKTEFSVCLLGMKKDNSYLVTGLTIPKTYEQDVFHVTAEMCSKETLIALHSHPYKKCIFSEQDINYYEQFHKINKDGLIALMCEPGRFTFYP